MHNYLQSAPYIIPAHASQIYHKVRDAYESLSTDHWNVSEQAPPHKGPGPPLKGTMNGRKSSGGIKYTGPVAPPSAGPVLIFTCKTMLSCYNSVQLQQCH